MLKQYLEVGKIVGTHGIRGEVRVQPWADTPDFLKGFKTLYFDNEGNKKISVKSSRVHGNLVLIKFDGIDTVEDAALLREKILFMNRKDAHLADGDYFIQDLIGCKVVDINDSHEYGKISDVSSTGANDVWHITDDDGKEYLMPAIPLIVKKIDVKKEKVEIDPIRGIFDDEN